jgi:Ca2+-dependent lipid-binding protein
MYDPNVFTLNLEQMLSGKPLDAAIGVVQVTVRAARNVQGSKIGGGVPDPYVSLSINERAELARTRYKTNTYVDSTSFLNLILLTLSPMQLQPHLE